MTVSASVFPFICVHLYLCSLLSVFTFICAHVYLCSLVFVLTCICAQLYLCSLVSVFTFAVDDALWSEGNSVIVS